LGGLQKSVKDEECSDIEKREGSGRSKSQTPLGVTVLERMEKTGQHLDKEAGGACRPPTTRSDGIEGGHGK
jgi:hypothetical protein